MSQVAISVLIVSYKTPQLTAAAVTSALLIPAVNDVIVVDNDSNDGTLELLHRIGDPRLRVVVNAVNVGYGSAANRAAAMAAGSVLVFLNSDAELTAPAAERLAESVISSRGRCIVGPKLVSLDGTVQRSAGLMPGPLDLTVRALGLHHLGRALLTWAIVGPLIRTSRLAREYDSAVSGNVPFGTTMVSGACCAIGRDAFAELGGFDERFFLYFEDADLCRRALRAGMEVRYLPDVAVRHVGGASSSDDYHFGAFHARSMRQYLAKWYGAPGATLAVMLMWLRLMAAVGTPPRAATAWRAFRATVG